MCAHIFFRDVKYFGPAFAISLFVLLLALSSGTDAEAQIAPGSKGSTGSLGVKIAPPAVRDAGVRWRIGTGTWHGPDEIVIGLPPGDYAVNFEDVYGWRTPNPVTATVGADNTTTVTTKYRMGTLSIALPGGAQSLYLRWVPQGSFMMGRYRGEQDSETNERPRHPVTFAQGFWICQDELTRDQWFALMNTAPWAGKPNIATGSNAYIYPAVYVSWNDAQAFVAALNAHVTNTDQGAAAFALPSEAQWEYACRANTKTRYYWGDDPNGWDIWDYAWFEGNTVDEGESYAHAGGWGPKPNAWRLNDMSGNVKEWCEDWYHSSYNGAPSDGSAWVSPAGQKRVLRGGAWDESRLYLRSAARYSATPSLKYPNIGFRLVRMADE